MRKNTQIFRYEDGYRAALPYNDDIQDLHGWTTKLYLKRFKRQRRLILLDIGGTLVHQVKVDPLDMFSKSNAAETKSGDVQENSALGAAPNRPPRAVMVALRALAADTQRNSVYLVSGQDRATVASHFESIPRLGLVTDSGYSFRNAGEENIHSWETMDEHFDLSCRNSDRNHENLHAPNGRDLHGAQEICRPLEVCRRRS